MRSSRRLFTRRRNLGAPVFWSITVLALLGASVLAFSPAHAPTPGHNGLHAQAATVSPPAPPVAAPGPRLQPEARSSLIIIEERIPGTRIRFQGGSPPP